MEGNKRQPYVETIINISGVLSSTFASDVYGLIQRVLCLICVGPYFNTTMPLVQHCVITNGLVYDISYLYEVLLVIMTLSPTLRSQSNYLYWFSSGLADILITHPPCVLMRESYYGQIIIGPDYNLLTYFLLIKLKMLLQQKISTIGHLRQHRFV